MSPYPTRPRVYALATLLVTAACCAVAQTAAPAVTAELSVARRAAYVHEDIDIELAVASAGVNLARDLQLVGLPDGRFIRFGTFQQLPLERRQIGNRSYEVRRYRATARLLAEGPLVLSPTVRVGILTRRRAFIGSTWAETPHTVRVPPLELKVRPLPEDGRPASFSGAVGQFAFDVDVSPRDVAVGDLVVAYMTLKGRGHLEGVETPRIAEGRHFRVYDATPVAVQSETRLAFEQTLVPLSTNAAAVPAISFCYFDPRTGTYQTVTRGPFPLTFHAAEKADVTAFRPAPGATGSDPAPRTAAGRVPRLPSLVVAGGLGMLCVIGLVFAAGVRRRAVVVLLLLAVAALGICLHVAITQPHLFRRAEVTLHTSDRARFAPARAAPTSFEVAAGAAVRVLEIHGRWAKIELGRKRGWIPLSALDDAPAKSPVTH